MTPNSFLSARLGILGTLVLAAYGCDGASPAVEGGGGSSGKSSPVGGVGGSGSGGSGGGGRGALCSVDFPCFGRLAKCVGDRQLQRYRDVSCSEVCGDRPCEGGACYPTGDIVDCPAGERCREPAASRGPSSAQCVAVDGGVCDDEDAGALGAPPCPIPRGCGDGRLDYEFREGCDDGNRNDGDGCDRNCKREAGFECPVAGMLCAALQFGDADCSQPACKQGPRCVELGSGLACRCSGHDEPPVCGALILQSLPMPDDRNRFYVQALSRDGKVVGGKLGRPDMSEGGSVTWSSENGSRLLPVETWFNIGVIALSFDGSRQLLNESTSLQDQSARGLLLQGDHFVDPSGLPEGVITDMDDSGSVLVGFFTPDRATAPHALRFAGGAAQDLGLLDADACPDPACEPRDSQATAVSGDGKVVVGTAAGAAFRWSEATGMRRLAIDNPEATSTAVTRAIDVSGDGSYVLGWSDASGSGVVRWDAAGEVELIAAPVTEQTVHRLEPAAISSTGRVIVGSLHFESNDGAFIWDDVRGARELKHELADAPDIANWHFDSAVAVSADGSIVAGNGSYRGRAVAYVAHVSPPP